MRQLTQYFPTPLLAVADPMASRAGTLDPLGLYSLADSLALRLVPGVRERQKHPRFLTAVAVSLAVTGDFEPDSVAKDGISEPWQVFECYLVEGLVRTAGAAEEQGLSGFHGTLDGPERYRRTQLLDAVRDGLEQGAAVLLTIRLVRRPRLEGGSLVLPKS